MMAKEIFHGRYTAQIDGDFVVFMIGARASIRQVFKNFWVGQSFNAMVNELNADSESGFLGGESFVRMLPFESILVSYWRSFDALERFARDRENLHYPAWIRFYKEIGANSDYGIWHETYMIRAGEYECIYGNMPKFGLGNVRGVQHVSLKEASRARNRSGKDDQPETVADIEAVMS